MDAVRSLLSYASRWHEIRLTEVTGDDQRFAMMLLNSYVPNIEDDSGNLKNALVWCIVLGTLALTESKATDTFTCQNGNFSTDENLRKEKTRLYMDRYFGGIAQFLARKVNQECKI